MSQYRPASGYIGVDSNTNVVQPLRRAPYTTYVWPVIHPQSATHANRSPRFRSKVVLVVKAEYSEYPPVVWTKPLGWPVDPEV